jgi:protease I
MAKIAVALADGFEDSEFAVPDARLREAGHEITVFGTHAGETVTGKRGNASHRIEAEAAELNPDDFDALLVPGGHSPDKLRLDAEVVDFTRRFFATGKPVAAICHGPQLLIEAELVKGRTLTSWPSVRTDLINAGAYWVDQEVVIDGNLITSRKPDDLSVFCTALLETLP